MVCWAARRSLQAGYYLSGEANVSSFVAMASVRIQRIFHAGICLDIARSARISNISYPAEQALSDLPIYGRHFCVLTSRFDSRTWIQTGCQRCSPAF